MNREQKIEELKKRNQLAEEGGGAKRRERQHKERKKSARERIEFLLDDGTGQCLIDPRGAEVFPGATNVWYGPEAWPQGRIPDGSGVFGWLVSRIGSFEAFFASPGCGFSRCCE